MVERSAHYRIEPKSSDDGDSDAFADQVFICYRRQDGADYADWLYDLLDHSAENHKDIQTPRISVFFDKMAPGVEDWQEFLQPNLESAGALLLICTLGLATDLSKPGHPDYAYKEIRWWLSHRTAPPIVVDPTGSGDRWLPAQITEKWPNLNRIELDHNLIQQPPDPTSPEIARIAQRIRTSIHSDQLSTAKDRLSKEIRLKKWSFAALAIAVSATALLTWSLISADAARESAVESRRVMLEATQFLTGIFREADPDEHFGNKLTAEHLLNVGAAKLDGEITDPAVRIQLLQAMGSAHIGLGMADKALQLLEQASAESSNLNLSVEDRIALTFAVGEAHLYSEDYETAKESLEEARFSAAGSDTPALLKSSILVALSDLEQWSPEGDLERGRELLQDALAIDTQEGNRLAIARDHNRLGYLEYWSGELSTAETHLLKSAEIAREEQAPLMITRYENDLAGILYQNEDFVGAEKAYRQSLSSMRYVFGVDSGTVGAIENNLARILIEHDATLEAIELLQHAQRVQTVAFGDDYFELGFTLNNLGYLQLVQDPKKARETLIRAADISQAESLPILAQTLTHVAESFLHEGNLQDAESYLSKAKAAFDAQGIGDGWRYGIYQSAMAEARIFQCFYSEAERLLESSQESFDDRWKVANPFTIARSNREQLLVSKRSANKSC